MAQYRKTSDLPDTLPVFPLPGAMLFPRWELPLNIFEPRYLNMFDDAMRGHRLIGMIQSMGGSRERPEIARVGCAGRITSYSETDDGRYIVTLTGICRFTAARELPVTTPYRQVAADSDRDCGRQGRARWPGRGRGRRRRHRWRWWRQRRG